MDALPIEFFWQGLCGRTAEKVDHPRRGAGDSLSTVRIERIETPSELDGVSLETTHQKNLICYPRKEK